MPQSAAHLETTNGSKYLVQLCKHFAHKITVSYTDTHGECQFASGTASLDADARGLRMLVTSGDEAGLVETQSIIESHLARFAFRETFDALDWQRQDKAAMPPLKQQVNS